MAKNSKKRKNGSEKALPQAVKKLKQDEPGVVWSAETAAVNLAQSGGMIGGLIYEDELDTTTDTLLMLANNPALIGLKALKPFKTAVHDYWRVANEATQTGACNFPLEVVYDYIAI